MYRQRWTTGGLFPRLESVLHDEILSDLQAALEASHELGAQKIEISTYYLASEVTSTYEGMMVATPAQA